MLGLLCLTAHAIPAIPTPIKVTHPDGTTVTITMHGDEFYHFITTQDGYTVIKNDKGYYTYAQRSGNRLVSSTVIAHDAGQRTAAERAALKNLAKGLTSPEQVSQGQQMRNSRNRAMRRVGEDGTMDYSKFRGLIILVNFSNKKFSMPDPNDFYDTMVNTHDFTGFTLNGRTVPMTGSVRDYFYDNSNHQFDPRFDIVGPVDINYSCTYPQGTTNAHEIFIAALEAADSQVNFSDYDTDRDGFVDMVFFLVAGYSSSYQGNNESYLWPHMHYLYDAPMHDRKYFNLYACSTEMWGWQGYGLQYCDIEGIGTFCHEFSHVLGLPDLYDTNYDEGGGVSVHPNGWSIMSGGSHNNFGRNPVGYSLYERYALGFSTPRIIDQDTEVAVEPLDVSNTGYRLNTNNDNEFFLIENRQYGKWDQNLPGYGMLVARVDSTDEYIWWSNQVNCRPNHMYYELLRADYAGVDSQGDPFPGSSNVTAITNRTAPSLRTWDSNMSDIIFTDITETGQNITFNAVHDTTIVSLVEDFEAMPVTTSLSAKGVTGVFSVWDFSNAAVSAPDSTLCRGAHAVAMKKPSSIKTCAPLQIIPYAVHYTVFNPSVDEVKMRVYYSTDNGETWLTPINTDLTVPGQSMGGAFVELPTDAPIMLKIGEIAGKAKVNCYLDDIKLYYDGMWPQDIYGDVNGDGEVNIADVNTLIDMILTGSFTTRGDLNSDGEANIADVNILIGLLLQ